MRKLLIITTMLTNSFIHNSFADGKYVRIDGGMHQMNFAQSLSEGGKGSKWAGFANIGLGTTLTDNTRVDGNVAYFAFPKYSSNTTVNIINMMLGAYYDYDISQNLQAYAGIKGGATLISLSYQISQEELSYIGRTETKEEKQTVYSITPSLGGAIGLTYKVSDDILLDTSYNYYYFGSIGATKEDKIALKSHVLSAGLRFYM